MTRPRRSRLVYSTEEAVCIRCGEAKANCRCAAPSEPVPDRITARLRVERSGRKGKTVTVVDGLPRNPELLADLASELKRVCGAGGTSGADRVEVQGDHRERLRDHLTAKGWRVKG